MIRTYSELCTFQTFEGRLNYLMLRGKVGEETFGFDRYFNQLFYRSKEWKDIRNYVIARDNGCDLGCIDHPIFSKIMVHHMNPINIQDIREASEFLLNPEYLISTIKSTHDAIHYGIEQTKPLVLNRQPNDTSPWR